MLTTSFLQTNLVSDILGLAQNFDPNLVNPWGLSYSPSSPFWVSDNNSGLSTLYNGQGQPQSLVVTIPQPDGTPGGAPTGTVFNSSPGFNVTENGVSRPAVFLFATEDGTIAGWNPGVDPTNAILGVDNSTNPTADDGAVYKGLAIAQDPDGRTLLYAANFRAGAIDVFDRNFNQTTVGGDFVDPNIPDGFAPFDVQELNGQLYVTYAMQDPDKHDDVAGPGNGFVDVFDTNGMLLQRLASGGPLNSPWGLALAPDHFGEFSHALLVGNFGDGHINAFNPRTGRFLGELADPQGNPITIGGLWALKFGNDGQAGSSHTLFFSAGIGGEQHGLFGSIQAIKPVDFNGDPDATALLQTDLVSDIAGAAAFQDHNLRNPWGLTASTTSPFWVSDNGSAVSTLYNGEGQPQSLVVTIPLPGGAHGGTPTGTIFNGGSDFVVSKNGASGPARFLFATEQGVLAGWNPAVDPTNAVVAVDNSASPADYTGLALADGGGQTLLYAANFASGAIDVFDGQFNPTTVSGSFTDDQLPPGFAPYNVQEINGNLYVTYARQDLHSQVGDGFVDVYSPDGMLLQRLVAGGPLNEPWGLALAPDGFGAFSNDLLVGNVRDGHINAFDPTTGALVGTATDGLGNPIAINGLWGLQFGNDAAAGDSHTLFFNAGIGGYAHGLFGSLQAIHPVQVRGVPTPHAGAHPQRGDPLAGAPALFVPGAADSALDPGATRDIADQSGGSLISTSDDGRLTATLWQGPGKDHRGDSAAVDRMWAALGAADDALAPADASGHAGRRLFGSL